MLVTVPEHGLYSHHWLPMLSAALGHSAYETSSLLWHNVSILGKDNCLANMCRGRTCKRPSKDK